MGEDTFTEKKKKKKWRRQIVSVMTISFNNARRKDPSAETTDFTYGNTLDLKLST